MAVTLIKGDNAIRKASDKIIKNVGDLKSDVHNLLVSVTLHHFEHGDSTVVLKALNDVLTVMAKASHANSCLKWVEKYSCLSYSAKAKAFVHSKAKVEAQKERAEAYIQEVMESKRYDELTTPPAFRPVKLIAMLKREIKRYDDMSEADKAREGNDVTGYEQLKAIVLGVAA